MFGLYLRDDEFLDIALRLLSDAKELNKMQCETQALDAVLTKGSIGHGFQYLFP